MRRADYPDDFTVRGTDLVMLAARTDDDVSHLEVYVYEEPVLNGTDEGNLYCHHDLLLPAFPLCISWMDCPTDGREGRANRVAVGTMYPGIEIWDLDVIDAVEPVATLGGYEDDDIRGGGGSEDEDESRMRLEKVGKKTYEEGWDAAGASRERGNLRSRRTATPTRSWVCPGTRSTATCSPRRPCRSHRLVRVWDISSRRRSTS